MAEKRKTAKLDYAALGKAGSIKKLEKYTAEQLSEQAKRGVATREANKARRKAEAEAAVVIEPPKREKRVGLFKTMTPEEILAFRQETGRRGGKIGGQNRARNLGSRGMSELQRQSVTKARGFANTPKLEDDGEVKFSRWGNPLTEKDLKPTRGKGKETDVR